MSKILYGRQYSDDSLTLLNWVPTPAPNKSEPATQVKVGGETYSYNGLTVTWPNH